MPRSPLRYLAATTLLLPPLAGCGDDAPTAEIDRATFIDTYVELRTAALQRGLPTVGDALRDSVLTARGVTDEQLVEFAEVHGAELEYMRDVWIEVAAQLDSISFAYIDPDGSETGGSDTGSSDPDSSDTGG